MQKLEVAMLEDDTTAIFITIENATNQTTIKIYEEETLVVEFSILKETSGNDLSYTIQIKADPEEENTEVSLKIQYNNLSALDNVEENYEVKLSYEAPSVNSNFSKETTEVSINYKNLKTFS